MIFDGGTDWNTFEGRWGLAGGGPTGPSQKLLWTRTAAGEKTPETIHGEHKTQLREYVTTIASLYQASNAFHSFHHASHVTM